MHRRYFEHIYVEICVAVNRRISRYDLWLRLGDAGGDPAEMSRTDARHFVDHGLCAVLAEEGASISDRARRRLERRILRFDPCHPTPEEWLTKTFDRAEDHAERAA